MSGQLGRSFETKYVEWFFRRQRMLWEIYANDANDDLTGIDAALFEACRSLPASGADGVDGRVALLSRVATRGAVDFHPLVAGLRNRLDRPDNYRAGASSTRTAVAAAMEPDVVALIKRRNQLAHDAGFASYGHLVMWSERLNYDAVLGLVSDTLDAVICEASRLVAEESITMETWWDDLARMAGAAEADPVGECRRLVAAVGLEDLASRLTWVVADQPIFGVAGVLSVPDDVRILLGEEASLSGTVTAFHELGHALAHAGNQSTGIDRTWDIVTDESMAAIVERIGTRLLFSDDQRARIERMEILESARMTTSFVFEVAVNEDPAAARDLYQHYYQALATVGDPVLWAVDSFRSVDPFHIHAYLIGAKAAEATFTYLSGARGDDPGSWGPWLATNLFADGRRRTLVEKLDAAGARPEHSLRALQPTDG